MEGFFEDLFSCYPADDPLWRVYMQASLKVVILFENKGDPREMLEIRSGRDGKTEMVDGKPHVLATGEKQWIAIEPSNKQFKYDGTKHWGAAAYPKKPDEAESQWVILKSKTAILKLHDSLRKKGLVIPYYQIAETLKSLYPDKFSHITPKLLEAAMVAGKADMGLGNVCRLVQSRAIVLGRIVHGSAFSKHHPMYPLSYRDVPIERGSLLIIDLDDKRKKSLKSGTVKYRVDGTVVTKPIIARIIDAPAVKAAVWTDIPYPRATIKTLLHKAQQILCSP